MKATLKTLDSKVQAVHDRIDGLDVSVNDRIDKLDKNVNDRIDKLDKSVNQRMDHLGDNLTLLRKESEGRFRAVDDRFDRLEGRFDNLEGKFDKFPQILADMLVPFFVNIDTTLEDHGKRITALERIWHSA